MTTINTEMGPNSVCINYTAGTTDVEMMAAITTWVTAHGWTVHDNISTTNVVFKAPNLDDSTFKYVWVKANIHVYMTACEYWNATTHTSTNPIVIAGNGLVSTNYQYEYTNHTSYSGKLYLFACPRYMLFYGVCSNGVSGSGFSSQSPQGVFEFTRDIPGDTVALGLPVHAQVDLCALSGFFWSVDNVNAGGQASVCNTIMFCRTKAGLVGQNASGTSRAGVPGYGWGFSLNNSSRLNSSAITTLCGGSIYGSNYPFGDNPITGAPMANNITAVENGGDKQVARGRLCGLKLLNRGVGSILDIVPIKINTTTMLADESGTSTDHWILGAYGSVAGYVEARYAIPA